jgi:hypothetical protein
VTRWRNRPAASSCESPALPARAAQPLHQEQSRRLAVDFAAAHALRLRAAAAKLAEGILRLARRQPFVHPVDLDPVAIAELVGEPQGRRGEAGFAPARIIGNACDDGGGAPVGDEPVQRKPVGPAVLGRDGGERFGGAGQRIADGDADPPESVVEGEHRPRGRCGRQ